MKDDFKKRIVKDNLNLPLHEIKKILKKRYPTTTNNDVEKLINSVVNNPNRNKIQDNEENER